MSDPKSAQLSEVLASAENLPTMPAVAVEVVRLAQDEDSTIDQLAEVLSRDPALSAKLLKLANSSLFKTSTEVTTLQRATMVLGLKTVKLMSLSFSLAGALPASGEGPFDFRAYWRRSVVCAVAGRAFAAMRGSAVGDEAFLVGLLSRIGQLVLGHGLPARYAAVEARAAGRWPTESLEREVLGFGGSEVGRELLRSWSLPALITDAVGAIREPDGLPADAPEETRELARIAHLAAWCEELVCGEDKRTAHEALLACAQEGHGLGAEPIEEFLHGLEVQIGDTAQMLQVEMRAVSMEQILREAQEQLVRETLGVASEMVEVRRRAEELETTNRELLSRAQTDPLTGLPNRARFDEALSACLSARRRGMVPEAVGLLMIDIDHFKAFNDTYGHRTGDEVLRAAAQAMREVMREEELIARYGGEEFAAVLPSVSETGLELCAERVRSAVEEARLEVEGASLAVTVSVGGAYMLKAEDAGSGERLVESADRCLYRAKQNGRNRCELAAAESC